MPSHLMMSYIRTIASVKNILIPFSQHGLKMICDHFWENWTNHLVWKKFWKRFSKNSKFSWWKMTSKDAIKSDWAKESESIFFVSSSYGSTVININMSANLSCWWRYRVLVKDSQLGVINIQAVLYLCAKFHNFLTSCSVGFHRLNSKRGRKSWSWIEEEK